ncbi:MAG TPA: threonine synthase [Gammaproteobacteria bacterium]|nr:threonine synthase [Gammaproteobacteria bacterium]
MPTKKKPVLYTGLINRYRDYLPLPKKVKAVTLNEGNTPLIRLENLPRELGVDAELYVKFEGANPTGSFKDRGMTVAVTRIVHDGGRAIICASTGNTSASAAAYAARAGIRCFVLIPDGKIAMGKLAQAMMHGSTVIQIKGNFDDGMRLVKEVAQEAPVGIVNSINPYRPHGQKTIAFEIIEALGRAPDYHCLPVGNAANIAAHWIGYTEYSTAAKDTAAHTMSKRDRKYKVPPRVKTRPVMLGYQAAGSAPFMRGGPVANPETVATAIRIGNPQSWDYAWAASRESGGWFDEFEDSEILRVQKLLAEREGIFCEPASAVSVAGALKDLQNGKIPAGGTIVCTLTGHGLKDPETAIKQSGAISTIEPNLDAVKRAILDKLS